jgi:PD-(D/E)XK nuclease superfamily
MARVKGTAGLAREPGDLPEHLSYSQLTMLDPAHKFACPRKWGYKYVIGLPEEPSPALLVGRGFDDAINRYFTARLEGSDPLSAAKNASAHGLRLLAESMRENNLPHLIDKYTPVLEQAIETFFQLEGNAAVVSVQDRHAFTVRITDKYEMPIVGYSDRLDADGTIVDHKFSGSPRWDKDGNWNEEWVSARKDQLLIYWLARAAREAQGEKLDPPLSGVGRLVVLYHKPGNKTAQLRFTEVSLSLEEAKGLLRRIGDAALVVRDGQLPARPGPACSLCSFVTTCRSDERERGKRFLEMVAQPF